MGDTKAIDELLLSKKYSVDYKDDEGRTALHWAAEKGKQLLCPPKLLRIVNVIFFLFILI